MGEKLTRLGLREWISALISTCRSNQDWIQGSQEREEDLGSAALGCSHSLHLEVLRM